MSNYVFASPSRYLQGVDLLNTLGEQVEILGKQAFVLADEVVWDLYGEQVSDSFKASNTKFFYEIFKGEASENEIDRLTDLAKDNQADVVIVLGGGKAIDTAKALADNIQTPVVIVPTAASTDAPTSALSVIYSDSGVFESYRFYDKNPDLVLVDTKVVANAPAKLFASGIADAMATCVEASATLASNTETMAGGKPTLAGLAIARTCEDTLFRDGLAAYLAVKNKTVTPAVERVTEANTLLSGLGFENGGLAAAHAIHNGFTALEGDIHDLTHGEKVTYGTLVQLVLENRPLVEIKKYIDFYKSIEMPTTLEEMHLDKVSFEDLVKVGALANQDNDTMGNLRSDITAEEIAHAIQAVSAISKA